MKKICKKKGISLNSYVNNILRKYISSNSEKIRQRLNIDIIGIKRQLIAESQTTKSNKELNEFEKKSIEKMVEIFKTASEMPEERLQLLLNLSQESLDKILFFNNDELQRNGLNLEYRLGNIIRKKV